MKLSLTRQQREAAEEQRRIRRNQPSVTVEEARRQFAQVQRSRQGAKDFRK